MSISVQGGIPVYMCHLRRKLLVLGLDVIVCRFCAIRNNTAAFQVQGHQLPRERHRRAVCKEICNYPECLQDSEIFLPKY